MSTKLGSENGNRFKMNLSYKVGDDPECVQKNRKTFFSQFGISEKDLAVPQQCHSGTVLRADIPGIYSECDALITNNKHVALVVTIADCVPILLFDPIKQAIGAVHAGWRGTYNQIVSRTIERLTAEYGTDPSQILAYIGPSAGVCCYEVGREVAVMFGNKIVPSNNGKIYLNLKKENRLQLLQQGVFGNNIEMSASCTICEKDMYHSYRRDSRMAGRMMAVISMI